MLSSLWLTSLIITRALATTVAARASITRSKHVGRWFRLHIRWMISGSEHQSRCSRSKMYQHKSGKMQKFDAVNMASSCSVTFLSIKADVGTAYQGSGP